MITCQVCDKEFLVVTSFHLEKHSMTVSDYREEFPDAPITSRETLERKAIANKGKNNPMYGKHHTKEWKDQHSIRMKGRNHPRWIPREERICPFCRGAFTVRITQKQRFCSTGCYNEWKKGYYKLHDHPNKGRVVTEEFRQYFRDLFKGRTLNTGRTHFKKGEPSWWTKQGLPSPSKRPEVREKIRRSMEGENNSNWRGGISYEPYGQEFNDELRERVRERDNHTCQKCGTHQDYLKRALSVHHIDYNKKNNESSNLISLCNPCNVEVNYNREIWTENFMELIA